MTDRGNPRIMDAGAMDALLGALRARGLAVIGPVLRDGAIDLGTVRSAQDLPAGWRDEQEAGRYRLAERGDGAMFGFANGPMSWKHFLHPPRERLWQADLSQDPPVFADAPPDDPPMAFLGVRACDLAAIAILDEVLAADPHYQARRRDTAIVAVNCTEAGATCFCASMETGPAVSGGADLVMTEILRDDGHDILLEPTSALGRELADVLPTRPAAPEDLDRAAAITADVAASMGRTLDTGGLKEAIADAAESAHWQDVAARCLTCGNCTMVCPTCFCSDMRDTSDLSGDHAERWREWQSCFTLEFSLAMGGSVRQSPQSRYRQWLTHKLSTWVDQFGMLGCVGCGRCITWCPVGIDITAEAAALRAAEEG